MRLQRFICALVAFVAARGAYALEVDSFTRRAEVLKKPEMTEILEQMLNQQLQASVRQWNQTGKDCRDDAEQTEREFADLVYTRLVTPIRTPILVQTNIENWMLAEHAHFPKMFLRQPWRKLFSEGEAFVEPDFDRYGVATVNAESIYGALTPAEGYTEVFLAQWKLSVMAGFNLAGSLISADKIAHFFDQGLEYYRLARAKSIKKALEASWASEDGKFGLGNIKSGIKVLDETASTLASKIFSHGDLAANASGIVFWYRAWHGSKPYLSCDASTGKIEWNAARPFRLKDYWIAAWDEGVNCSDFPPQVKKKVDERLAALKMQCPVQDAHEKAVCGRLEAFPFSSLTVHASCRGTATAEKVYETLDGYVEGYQNGMTGEKK